MNLQLAIIALLAGTLLGGWLIGQFLLRIFSYPAGGYYPPGVYRPVPTSGNFGWLPLAAIFLLGLWALREQEQKQEPVQQAPEKQEQFRRLPPAGTEPMSRPVKPREPAYFIQLGEFYRESDAERFRQAWQERSTDPVQLWYFGEDEAPYKVLAGPFSENEEEITSFLKTHRIANYQLRVSR